MSSPISEVFDDSTVGEAKPDLTLLASQAAVQLNSLFYGKKSELNAVEQLARFLETSFEKSEDTPSTNTKLLLDPSMVVILTDAFDNSSFCEPVKTTAKLIDEAWNVADNLKNTRKNTDMQELKKIRDFCAALSVCAADYYKSLLNWLPKNPYMR